MHSKLRWPNRDTRSLLRKKAAAEQDLIASLMQVNLSCGSDACISTLPRVMLRNSKHVQGLIVFSSERGTPNSWKRLLTMEMLRAGGDEGKSTTKNVV